MQRFIFLIILFCLPGLRLYGQESSYSDSLCVSEIKIEGNFITKKKIIYRELAFENGKYVGRDKIEYLKQTSINNLNKTALFNFVEINTEEKKDGILVVTVKLTERWFIWPTGYLNHTSPNFSAWWRTKDLEKLEYGVGIKMNNYRGLKESVMLNLRFGNYKKIEFEFNDIHLDRTEHHLLSARTLLAAQNDLPLIIKNNNLISLKTDYTLLNSKDFSVKYVYRKLFFNTHSFELGYSDYRISDTIMSLNPLFFGPGNQRQRFFSLEYQFTRDTRDSHFYPKTGYMLVADININGLGILTDEYHSVNFNFEFFEYFKMMNRFYSAYGLLFTSKSNKDKAFFEQTALGYLQFVRGYEYYTVNGNQTYLFKSLIKFELLPRKVINLRIWPIRKMEQLNRIPFEIYTNVFFDAGYVYDQSGIYKQYNNTLVNKLMYSTGAGIDFVTYYDKVLRFDYSFNGLGQNGLFIHWKAAIR